MKPKKVKPVKVVAPILEAEIVHQPVESTPNLFIVRTVNLLLGLLLGLGIAILSQLFINPVEDKLEGAVKRPTSYIGCLHKVLENLDVLVELHKQEAADLRAMREKIAK